MNKERKIIPLARDENEKLNCVLIVVGANAKKVIDTSCPV